MLHQPQRIMEIGHNYPPDQSPLSRVSEALGVKGAVLHELDYEDLALSLAGLRMVYGAALTVLRRFSSVEEADFPLARALALFLDHAFWDADSGELILCADFPERSYCLPIPRGMWGLKSRPGRTQ